MGSFQPKGLYTHIIRIIRMQFGPEVALQGPPRGKQYMLSVREPFRFWFRIGRKNPGLIVS